MRHSHIFLLLAFCSLVAGACTKSIEFDGETRESKLVINSLFNTEDTFKLHVSNSLALVDAGDLKPVEDAVVKVYDDADQLVATPTHSHSGLFLAPDFSPETKREYKVVVEHPDYKNVEASDIVPNAVSISSIDTQRITTAGGWEEYQGKVKFKDPEGEDNYYMIEVHVTYRYQIDSTTEEVNSYKMYLNTTDPSVPGNDGLNAVYSDQLVFTDRNFDGKEYEFPVNMEIWAFDGENNNEIELRLYSLSRTAYNYFISLDQYEKTRDNPFATPVQVFSNVESGFGIFGGASSSNIQLK